MLDTGASLSLCSSKVFEEYPDLERVGQIQALASNDPQIVYLPNGDTLALQGTLTVPVQFGNVNTNISFYMIDSFKYSFLIGYPCMQQLGGVISFKNRTFSVNPNSKVMLKRDVTVPPKSAIYTLGKVPAHLPRGFVGVFDPKTTFISNEHLDIPPNLSTVDDDCIPLRVINFSHTPMFLHRDTPVGTFHGLDSDADIADPTDLTSIPILTNMHTSPSPQHTRSAEKEYLYNLYAPPKNLPPVDHLIDFSDTWLTPEQKDRLIKLINQYRDVFATDANPPTGCTAYKHKVILKPNTPPVVGKYLRTPPQLQNTMHLLIQDYIRLGYLEESNSAFSASAMLIKKPKFKHLKNSTNPQHFRLVTDLRTLNNNIVTTYHPMARIIDILHDLTNNGQKYFTSADLADGYMQIKLEKSSRPYTAFRANNRSYQYRVLPQGLSDSSFAFTRVLQKVLEGTDLHSYLDDIQFSKNSFDGHLEQIETLFKRLRQYNLKIKPSKFLVCKRKLQVLGHEVDQNGIRPAKVRTEAISNYVKPKTKRQLRRFLGAAQFFKRFIFKYNTICADLFPLTSKKTRFKWTHKQDKAFNLLKKKLQEAPLLQSPNLNKSFELYVDSSMDGLGAMLCQFDDNGQLVPLGMASRLLTPGEQALPITYKELIGITYGLSYFSDLLKHGAHTNVYTDHRPLLSIVNQFNHENPRVLRNLHKLRNYDITVHFIKGKDNIVSDALSRAVAAGNYGKNNTDFEGQLQHIPTHDSESDTPVLNVYEDQSSINVRGRTLRNTPSRQRRTLTTQPKKSTPTPTTPISNKAISHTTGHSAPRTDPEHIPSSTSSADTDPSTDSNQDAEITSNDPLPAPNTTETAESDTTLPSTEDTEVLKPIPETYDLDLSTVEALQREDPYYSHLIKYLETNIEPLDRNIAQRVARDKGDHVMKDNKLYFIYKPKRRKDFQQTWALHLIIPEPLRTQVLYFCHTDKVLGQHSGIAKTIMRLYQQAVHWDTLNKDVVRYVETCPECQKDKDPKPKNLTPIQNYDVAKGPWPFYQIHIDTYGPLMESPDKFKYIIGICDRFSRYLILEPAKTNSTIEVANIVMNKCALVYGCPAHVHSDQGKSYTSKLLQALYKLLGIKSTTSSALHPQSNSLIENRWRFVRSACAKYLKSHKNWVDLLPYITHGYNTSPSEALGGLSPCDVIFGHPISSPLQNQLHLPDNVNVDVQLYVKDIKKKLEMTDKFIKETLVENHERSLAQKQGQNIMKGP